MDWLSPSLFIGLAIGWILGMIIDFLYWRNKRICSDAEKQLRASVRQLESDNSRINNALADANAEIESKDADMRRQTARFQAAQSDSVKQLELGNTQLRDRISGLEAELAAKSSQLDELSHQTQTLDVEPLQKLQGENDELRAKNAELRGQLHDSSAEIQRLAAIEAAAHSDTSPSLGVTTAAVAASAMSAPETPAPVVEAEEKTVVVTETGASEKTEVTATTSASATTSAATTGFSSAPAKPDDFKKLWGIGPALERILNRNDIMTFEQLSATSVTRLDEILESAGTRFQLANQKTWPEQARLAALGKWDELEQMQKGMSWD